MKNILRLKGLYINKMLQKEINRYNSSQLMKYSYLSLRGVSQCCNKEVKEKMKEQMLEYIECKMKEFNKQFNQQSMIMKEIVRSKSIDQEPNIINYLKRHMMLLIEVNEQIDSVQYLNNEFLKNIVQLALICTSLVHLSSTDYHELTLLSKLVQQNTYSLLTKYQNHTQLAIILFDLLNLEIGFHHQQLNLRLLHRLQDILVI